MITALHKKCQLRYGMMQELVYDAVILRDSRECIGGCGVEVDTIARKDCIMKNRKIAAVILTALMAISAMPMAVSARNVDSTNARGEENIVIKTSTGTTVGYGTIDFGTVAEPGAYGMAQRSSLQKRDFNIIYFTLKTNSKQHSIKSNCKKMLFCS